MLCVQQTNCLCAVGVLDEKTLCSRDDILIVVGIKLVIIWSQDSLSNHHIILLSMVTQSHCFTDINGSKAIWGFTAIKLNWRISWGDAGKINALLSHIYPLLAQQAPTAPLVFYPIMKDVNSINSTSSPVKGVDYGGLNDCVWIIYTTWTTVLADQL